MHNESVKIQVSEDQVSFEEARYSEGNGVALTYSITKAEITASGKHDSGFLTGEVSIPLSDLLKHVPVEQLEESIKLKFATLVEAANQLASEASGESLSLSNVSEECFRQFMNAVWDSKGI